MLSIIAVTFMALLGAAYGGDRNTTGPGPNEIFREGKPCLISWTHDTTGTWTSFGGPHEWPNLDMKVVTNAFKGLDGTKGNTTSHGHVLQSLLTPLFTFTNSTMQLAANLPGLRGSHASPTGETTPPAHFTQKNGRPIPWGVGELKTKK
ncbi:hypothetical protein PSHT_10158 [Puccinia striiformis]|uniref:Uncharacterized protein n=1 Tax=Puccinia striiformis TaxID=27350 RepID=A0A2S4VBN9_9BASI|nr:hypothetical protein PSHT_10158 [Puccinia striiformis]